MAINPRLKVGDDAPEFSALSEQGELHSKDFVGQKWILYFYPKDLTPGCTTQACDFNDNLNTFQNQGYTVYGISPDPVSSHEKFRETHDLGFTLLSDPDHAIAEAYGVWREKTNYGKVYTGLVRSTFLIDEAGKITAIYDNVKAKGHVAKLLRELT